MANLRWEPYQENNASGYRLVKISKRYFGRPNENGKKERVTPLLTLLRQVKDESRLDATEEVIARKHYGGKEDSYQEIRVVTKPTLSNSPDLYSPGITSSHYAVVGIDRKLRENQWDVKKWVLHKVTETEVDLHTRNIIHIDIVSLASNLMRYMIPTTFKKTS